MVPREWRWWWESLVTLSYALCPIALPSGMRRCLARTAVHLAWLIQHILKGILGPNCWPSLPLRLLSGLYRGYLPTAPCSPWCLLTLYCSHLPVAILHIRLLILPLSSAELTTVLVVVAVEVIGVVVVAVVLTTFSPIELVCWICRLPSLPILDDAVCIESNRSHR